jgi:hypothetical protein
VPGPVIAPVCDLALFTGVKPTDQHKQHAIHRINCPKDANIEAIQSPS